MPSENLSCPVCGGSPSHLDAVDFNKSCIEANGKFLSPSGISVSYALCSKCGFCFAPELMKWDIHQFEEKIYNDKYVEVDPDYIEARPSANAAMLIKAFGGRAYPIKHLDYGGGDGLLTKILNESNWQSKSYDPFVHRDIDIKQLGKFDLITAYEVFEHVPDVQTLMSNLSFLLNKNGLVLFSTFLTEGNIQPGEKLSWWYASPRNGHISLFSKQSLAILSQKFGFRFGSFSRNTHFFYTAVPAWAQHLIRGA